MINIDPPSKPPPFLFAPSKSALTRFLNRARNAVGLEGEVSLLLTWDGEMRRLNRQFRGKNKTTDVLSFPAAVIPGRPPGVQTAGDLAISIEVAAAQAERFGHPVETELRVLMLHGLLHLAGYDHETDAGEMAAKETELRAKLRLPGGLIGRTLLDDSAGGAKTVPVRAARGRGDVPATKAVRRTTATRGVRRPAVAGVRA